MFVTQAQDILIDVTRLLGRSMKGRLATGVDRVSLAYVHYFASRARAVVRYGGRNMVLSSSASQRLFELLPYPSSAFNRMVRRLVAAEFMNVWGKGDMTGSFLFNTGHSGLEHDDYPKQLRRLGVRPLFMVHDLIPISYPEYSRVGEPDKHVIRMNTVLEIAGGVITNSQTTLDDLSAYAERTGYAVPLAVAAPLAPPEFPPPSQVRPIAGPYFVMLSTIEPRKNHWLLLQLWRRLVERLGARAPRLVVIGQRGWECENVVDLLERCKALRGIVIELPACSDASLATYLYHAQALLFPSFAEGYGLPLVEALSMGVPVIASDLPIFHEIANDIPDYLDPLDGLGWLARIEAFSAPDSPARAAQLNRMGSFVTPTWAAHFRLVEGLMERML